MALDLSVADFTIQKWEKNSVDVSQKDKVITLVKNYDTIKFYFDKDKPIEECAELIEILSDGTLYLEWCDRYTGQYLYFNVLNIIKEIESVIIEIRTLSSSKLVGIDPNKLILNLSSSDILIPATVRDLYSMETDFSLINSYYNNKLYLGKWPTAVFIKKCDIKYSFNCCSSSCNDVIKLKCNEKIFNVADWKWLLIDELKKQNKFKNENENDKNKVIKVNNSKQLQILDEIIDLIDEQLRNNNVLIHCHAGMHRSAFITGCYLMKYGGYRNDRVNIIYAFMQSKRSIVEEMGYDRTLKRYQEFLDYKSTKKDACCIIL